MKQKEVEAIFTLAGYEVLKTKALIDGYGYSPDDERFFETKPRLCWWFVKTQFGWIEIGWRKRVISIDWEDTSIRKVVTDENITKSDTYVHAYSIEDAIKYLRVLKSN